MRDLVGELARLLPARIVGEETGSHGDRASPFCWLIDPHDGTSAFLKGHRGTAVSIALLRNGLPVLGVVCAPMSPDRGWDLIAWAEGLPGVIRNGSPLAVDLSAASLESGTIVFLNHDASRKPVSNGLAIAPARFISMPSIAYRLARVAAGDGVAAVSLNGPGGVDYAAGHALLRGSGGVLLDQDGHEVRYGADGTSSVIHCFGGAPKAVKELSQRRWSQGRTEPLSRTPIVLSWNSDRSAEDLNREKGCMFGQVIGDNLGALVEFSSAKDIAAKHPLGVRELLDGGVWNILAGQATDDSELALALARTLVATKEYNQEAVATAFGDWFASRPFDIGGTAAKALGAAARAGKGKADAAHRAADTNSQSNGSLMRVSPIGIWGRWSKLADHHAREDSRLSHPNDICVDACGVFAAAIAQGVRTGDPQEMLNAAQNSAQTETVATALILAAKSLIRN
ncbi:Inositol monophosphatase/ADP-ribosylglycohydrolase [alpha proteobacterium BAL199]|nr:Inositol monophosphatase/ADP-ribosylglycohydrolase [alpha proteobacterium BAL199]